MGFTVWARGANANAGNASLNVRSKSQIPTTELEFITSGTNGDYLLDFATDGTGAPAIDPDTTVLINGVEYSFTVEFSGTLPNSNKLTNVGGENLQGKTITVITAGDGNEYVFLTDPTVPSSFIILDDLPNGAFNIGNLQTTGSVVICFANGTLIDTPDGPRPVETLAPGMIVSTDAGPLPLRWVGQRKITAEDMLREPDLRPVEIATGALGPNVPSKPVRLSANHRVLLDGWKVELAVGEARVLCAAKHLIGRRNVHRVLPKDGVTYFHLMFDSHRLVTASGLFSESFEPGPVGMATLDGRTKQEVADILDRQPLAADVLPTPPMTIKKHQAMVLANAR